MIHRFSTVCIFCYFRWDENRFTAFVVDFRLFIVSDFMFICGKTAISTLGKLTAVSGLFSHAIIFSTTQETDIGNRNRRMKWTDVCYLGQIFLIFNAWDSMKFIWTRRYRFSTVCIFCCFQWDENCFIALNVDFGLFIVSDFKFIYGKTAVSTLGKLTAVIDLFSHAIVFSTTQETDIRLNQKQEMKWTDVCYLGQIFPIFNARYSMKFIWRRRRRNIYKYGEKLFRFLR